MALKYLAHYTITNIPVYDGAWMTDPGPEHRTRYFDAKDDFEATDIAKSYFKDVRGEFMGSPSIRIERLEE